MRNGTQGLELACQLCLFELAKKEILFGLEMCIGQEGVGWIPEAHTLG